MSWISFALGGYLLAAIATLLDKLLIRSRIPAPVVYAFFVSLFSLFALVFIPFGFGFFGWDTTARALLSGILFTYALIALYRAIKDEEISRVAPMVGAVVPAVALVISAFPVFGLEGSLSLIGLAALFLLITGGLMLAWRPAGMSRKSIYTFAFVLLSGTLLAFSFLLLKLAYADQNFVSGFVWSRIGLFLGGISLLVVPAFRERIFSFCCGEKRPQKSVWSTGAIFVLNKSLGGISYVLINYAIFLGPLVLVQALSSSQYAFVFVFSSLAAIFWPTIYEERRSVSEWTVKMSALVVIALGTWLAALAEENILLFIS